MRPIVYSIFFGTGAVWHALSLFVNFFQFNRVSEHLSFYDVYCYWNYTKTIQTLFVSLEARDTDGTESRLLGNISEAQIFDL